MAQTSRPKRPKQDEVVKVKRILANETKKKLQTKNTTRITEINRPSSREKRYNENVKKWEKSGFIKIKKTATLNEATGKSTSTKYTITPKGKKYNKDTDNAYSKDPMNLRTKPTVKKTKAQLLKELSKNA